MNSNEIQKAIEEAAGITGKQRADIQLRLEAARVQLLVDTIGQTASQTPEIRDSRDFDGELYIEVRDDIVERLTNLAITFEDLGTHTGGLIDGYIRICVRVRRI